MKKFRLLFAYIAKHKLSYVLAVLAILATNLIAVTIPRYVEQAVDRIASGAGSASVWGPLEMIVFLTAALIPVRILSRVLFYNPSRAIECEVKRDLLAKLLRLDRRYYDSNPAGAIISRINHDITGVRLLCGFGMLQVVNLLTSLTLAPYQMWLISPVLTLYCLLPVAAVFFFLRQGMKRLHGMVKIQTQKLQHLSGFSSSSLSGVEVIKNYPILGWAVRRFRELNRAWLSNVLRLSLWRSFLSPVFVNIEHILKIITLGAGGWFVLRQGLTVGELTAYLSYIAILTAPLMGLSWLMNMLQEGLVGLASVETILNQPEPEPRPMPPENFLRMEKGLEVRGLDFSYEGAGRPVLSGVSFKVLPGQKAGILGAVGAGKTTLVNCINGYLPVPAGRIFLNGRDITGLPLEAVRQAVRTVTQEPFLFSETVRDNVTFLSGAGMDGERLGKLLADCSLADEILRFPRGVETLVGERGIMLSGGQKQRISLARALAAPVPVLVLDNVLSAVDYETERRLLETIYSAQNEGALLIVSHRVRALERADMIFVLEEGRITAAGTHEELLSRPGYYRDTWLLQRETAPPGGRP